MISVIISIGSNCGDRHALVEKAIEWLNTILMQTKASSIYETPCALKSGTPYMNAVVKGYFSGNGFSLDDLLKEKEHKMGRTAECREKGQVPIDLDIVVCDGEILKSWDYRQRFFQIGLQQIED